MMTRRPAPWTHAVMRPLMVYSALPGLVFFAGSCATRPAADNSAGLDWDRTGGHGIESVSSTALTREDPTLGDLRSVTIAGKWIIAVDYLGPPFLRVFDRFTGAPRLTLGPRGDGPGDFTRAPRPTGSTAGPDNVVWFFDAARRVTGISVEALNAVDSGVKRNPISRVIRMDTVYNVHNRISIANGVFLGETYQKGQRILARLHPDGRVEPIGPLILDDPRLQDSIQADALSRAYSFRLCSAPSRDRFAAVYRWIGRGDVIDPAGRSIARLDVPVATVPVIRFDEETKRYVWEGSNGRRFYAGCVASERLIYALVEFDPHQEADSLRASQLHVFDWNGRFVRALQLDHVVAGFAPAPGDSLLYSVVVDPEIPEIRISRLPPDLRATTRP